VQKTVEKHCHGLIRQLGFELQMKLPALSPNENCLQGDSSPVFGYPFKKMQRWSFDWESGIVCLGGFHKICATKK